MSTNVIGDNGELIPIAGNAFNNARFTEPVKDWLKNCTSLATAREATCDGVLVQELLSTETYTQILYEDNIEINKNTSSYFNSITIPIRKGHKYHYSYSNASATLNRSNFYPFARNIVIPSDPTIYSTEEKVVGEWTDGKPIYRKAFTGLNIGSASDAWISHIVEVPNLDNVINMSLYGKYADGQPVKIGVADIESEGNYISVSTFHSGRYINTAVAEYTKTTD